MNDPNNFKRSKKIFESEGRSAGETRRDLEAACLGLTFISETDADVSPLRAARPPSRSLPDYLSALNITSSDIEEREFEKFFDRLASEKDWHGRREKERSMRWRRLREVLDRHLEDIRVIRVGKIQIDIYIVGVDTSGRLSGVKTKAIET